MKRNGPQTKPISLALQGGGAVGAFTWGVLDAFLADGRLTFNAISGTSAGAMNAVVLADGYHRGGRDGARSQLARFWQGVSQQSAAVAAIDELIDSWSQLWRLSGFAAYQPMREFAALTSPYFFNPLNYNPLMGLVRSLVDFGHAADWRSPSVHLTATNVETGKSRVFAGREINATTVMASACLPTLFQAIEIDGEAYWDGGYAGNPSLWPLYRDGPAQDILIVQLKPVTWSKAPSEPDEIADRIEELTFNNPLLHELRAISFVNRLMNEDRLDRRRYKRNRIHRIDATRSLIHDQISRTLDISPRFLFELRDAGIEAGQSWLAANFDAVGTADTLDLDAEFRSSRFVSRHNKAPQRSRKAKPINGKSARSRTRTRIHPVSLALQGGGGHGPFTWGVLEVLLDRLWPNIEAISGTSGGAINGVIVADALCQDRPDLVAANLERFWHEVSRAVALPASNDRYMQAMIHHVWLGQSGLPKALRNLLRSGPKEHIVNPLGPILESIVDFDRLQKQDRVPVFVSATNVETGRSEVFSGPSVSVDAVMASACLPYLFEAVEIDGVSYWDGGYSANPPLWPFFRRALASDILLIQLYAIHNPARPVLPAQIVGRINEITFNNALLQEFRAIDFVNRLMEEDRLDPALYSHHRLHRIHPTKTDLERSDPNWTDNAWPYFLKLREAGHRAATNWLDRHADDIGHRATVDLSAAFT